MYSTKVRSDLADISKRVKEEEKKREERKNEAAKKAHNTKTSKNGDKHTRI